jgi:hypothetical protein
MTVGWALITATFLLVVVGCVFYLYGLVGWAQFLFVCGSGTAGAAVIKLIEGRDGS